MINEKITQEIILSVVAEIDRAISNLSVNCAIFRFYKGQLEVATVNFMYAELTVIPGGFVGKSEDVEDAVRRLVAYQTGLTDLLIREVGIFGDANRSFRKEFKALQDAGLPERWIDWASQRFVSIAYYCTIDDREIKTTVVDPFFTRLQWLQVNQLEKLHLDHKSIVAKSLEKIALDVLGRAYTERSSAF